MRKLIACAALFLAAPLALAQAAADFPSKPIRIIVPFNAGSGSDETSRVYGEIVSKMLGQPVVVENRPGGSGLIAIQTVKAAEPDGHTIMLASNSPMTVNTVVFKKLAYDPVKEFRPVSGLGRGPLAFVVNADSPYKTIHDLAEAARTGKRSLTVGNYSAGYHLVAAWFGTVTGAEVTHVPYKGGGAALADLLPGRVDAMFCNLPLCLPHIESGKLRALGVTSRQASSLLPDVAPIAENGLPGYEVTGWFGLFAPAKVDPAIIDKLNASLMKTLNDEGIKQQLLAQGAETDGSSPAEFDQFVRAEHDKWARVIKEAGISIE